MATTTLLICLLPIVTACQATVSPVSSSQTLSVPAIPVNDNSAAEPMPSDSYLLFNQNVIEGLTAPPLDLGDPDAVFFQVFAGLPEEVVVYPSENYYYFVLYVGERQVWGNIRLAAGSREEGLLSFGYFEFVEFAARSGTGINGSKMFSQADGVDVVKIDEFTYLVRTRGKEVTFHLHQLAQTPPSLFRLGEGEVFVERTFDESGYQFFLLFNERENYFFWVLNEEAPLPDILDPVADDLLVGKRSGFAFWVDEAHDARKVLFAVRKLSVTRNDYHDGPFDQLADNYADETNVSEYMQRAFPALRGRIDKYGYYTDRVRPMRVALSTYLTYFAQSDLLRFIELVRESSDPYAFISQRGVDSTSTPSPVPTP
jgi:hypothetical protein